MANLPLHHDFTGKVVVITGAGGVLCGDMARAYAKAGAKVAALDLNEEAVKKLADELKKDGYICEGYKANALDREILEGVHQQGLADLGPCDILINGAGGNNPRGTTSKEYLFKEDLGNILTVVQLFRDAPVEIRNDILQEDAELNNIGFIIAHGFTAGFHNQSLGTHGVQRQGGQHADQHKGHEGDDQENHRQVEDSL